MQIGNFLKKGSGPILESKVTRAIFRAKGKKKKRQKIFNKGKIFEYLEKGQVIECIYCTQ